MQEYLLLDDLIGAAQLLFLIFVDQLKLNVLAVSGFDQYYLALGYEGLQRLQPNIHNGAIVLQRLRWYGQVASDRTTLERTLQSLASLLIVLLPVYLIHVN